MDNKITIQDIATLAGVSKSTVSRYLNQGYVSRQKADKVKKVIAETGFRSNFFAKRLKMKRSKLIGIVLPRMDSVTVGKLLTGMNRIFEPAGYQGLALVSSLEKRKELANIASLEQQGVDGIIIDSIGITPRHVELAKAASVPMVFTGQQHPDVHYIKIDDYGAGRMMGAYLKQMGHKKAVFAGVTEQDEAVGVDRKRGFYDAFMADNAEAHIDFVETGFDFSAAYAKAAEIWERRPTVVVCATDNIGLGILRYFHEQGIAVPQQVSITGFGRLYGRSSILSGFDDDRVRL
jgi:LacI family sucrose operon transcriptional repressor